MFATLTLIPISLAGILWPRIAAYAALGSMTVILAYTLSLGHVRFLVRDLVSAILFYGIFICGPFLVVAILFNYSPRRSGEEEDPMKRPRITTLKL